MLYDNKIREFTAKTKFQKILKSIGTIIDTLSILRTAQLGGKYKDVADGTYKDNSNGYFGWI